MERTNKREKLVIGAALGECVHVAGVVNFLRLADEQGYKTVSLGPAVSVRELVGAIVESDPELVAVGYRLTPSTAEPLFAELKRELERAGVSRVRLVFGGTAPVAEVAARSGLFEHVFNGEDSIEDAVAYLKGHKVDRSEESYPQTLVERIQWKAPFPIIRHHFGLPSLEETIEGARQIAEARVLDVLSIGTDQAAQESFFRPEELARHKAGAGGVPVRKPEDLRAIFEATRTGNYPLLRCYSGTRDQLKWAEMLVDTINNAWAAIPLTWYSVLDGRSQRPLLQTIRETQEAFKWHGDRGIPVESNESHHWSLRDAPDVVAVVMAFLAAYNARKMGVTDYVAQYMFNNPPATSPRMDLAKMLAKKELIAELRGPDFEVWTETRAGLSSYPTDLDEAKGHLAFSTALQMALKPHIVHVVAFTEAQHAARAHEVIESVKIARRVIEKVIHDFPDLADDERVQQRKEVLKKEAGVLLDAIKRLGESRGAEDPWGDPETLTAAVEMGLLDAPHLRNNPAAKGTVVTQIVDGACVAVDPETKRPLTEEERIARLMAEEAAGRAV